MPPAHGSQTAEERIGSADDGIEVCSRYWAHGENNRDKGDPGGYRILEQLEPSIAGTERLRGDARADHRDQQQCRADELGQGATHHDFGEAEDLVMLQRHIDTDQYEAQSMAPVLHGGSSLYGSSRGSRASP